MTFPFPIVPPTFLPNRIAGLVSWHRADLGMSVDGSNFVDSWADQSGNGRTLTGTTTTRPLLVASAVNGRPAVRFDGVDDILGSTSFTQAQPFHIFMVLQQDTWTANRRIFDGNNANTAAILQSGSSPNIAQFGGSAVNVVAPALDTWVLLQSYWSGASSFQALNNSAAVSGGNAGTASITGGFKLGNRFAGDTASDVDIAEIAIFNAEVTGQNLSQIRNYFNQRYQLY